MKTKDSRFRIQVLRFKFQGLSSKTLWCVVSLCLCGSIISCTDKKKTDKTVFTYNESTGIATLDPAFAKNQSIMWAVHQLYNTLVEIDTALHIVPSVAKSWDVSSD